MNTAGTSELNILITGANGFIGSALTKRLQADRRFSVRAAVRSMTGLGRTAGAEVFETGDLAADTDWQAALQGIGVVVHLAARAHVMRDTAADPLTEYRKVNVDGTLNLASQALQAGIKRFIFISSIKVNGEQTPLNRPFRAEDHPSPVDAYGISKREAEDGLRALCANSGMDFVIIRPPLVYGPGVKGNFLTLLRCLDKGLPLPLASIRNKRSLVSVDNLADLIVICIEHPSAANQTFLASDGEDLSTPELLQRTAAAIGKEACLWSAPVGLLHFAAQCAGKTEAIRKLCGSLQLDIAKTCERLGWRPPVAIDQALQATARYYLGARK
ncbi:MULTISPECIES: UDP-glucose 4-epimerase family protein [Methylomicrobium]|uniref:Nucleoside-diphosphate-sugar epimerase n=1 Tax=Methylomicrobium album BG8 TaxID=686340 RepID=H8GP95_METAL|nr:MULTISPECIES: SDR family oxidoreductase [Methylomicrobium]EIC29681.1 nucleoside-diphosphate-sugar epimerase [Methylomicrobium album BG8]